MKIKLQLHLLIYIAIYSFAVSQDFFVPPLDTGVVGNGARTFNLQLQNGTTSFFPGIETETCGYNGNFLGPTLLMQKGDSVIMNVTNTMPFATTTHWHGIHLPAVMDGGPHQLIEQNETWIATWEIKNRASTYWYHPHPHPDGFPIDTLMATGWQVYQGMAGLLIVKDTETDTLGLPAEYGVDDIPIILQDRSFTADSSHFAPIPPQGSGLANIRRGYTIMVNGVVTPILNSHAQMIRMRILNASNARTYRLGFSDNRPFFVIGSDGGILDTVSTVTRLDMSPAERYEIVVDFSNTNGSTIKLMAYNSEIESNIYPNGLPGNIYWISPLLDDYDTSDFDIMTFEIGDPTANAVTSFNQELTEIVRVDPVTADNVNNPRAFVLAAPAGNGNGFTINGSLFDASIIDDVINLGALEVWDIENTANMAHPFHIHGNSFQVVSRTNGVRPMHDYELGWKDVVVVYSQETVRIIKSFEDYADPDGPYMSHCHILEHEDAGMMTHWVVVDQYQPTISLQFDGNDDRVTVPYDSSFPTEVFTISAWVKLNQPEGRAAIIARGEDNDSYNLSWQLFVSSLGELEIMLEDEDEQNFCYPYNDCVFMGACTIVGDLFISDNMWHHVVATRDESGTLSMYIDGELRASCEGTGIPSSDNYQNLSIGCTFGYIGPPPDGVEPPIWFFTGQIDEPTMWNESLSHEEIVDLFISNININSPELMGYWTFNEGGGQIVFDLSLAENNGYLGDSPEIDSSDPFWDVPGQGELIVDHLANWNLISLPVQTDEYACNSIDETTLYSFEEGGYVNTDIDEMETGNGYWLRFDEEETCTFTGIPINETNITLTEGWNLIGGISSPVDVNSITDENNLIIPGTVYGFESSYFEAETIEPGYGYWLRSSGEGEITLSSSTPLTKSRLFQPPEHLSAVADENTLKFGNQTLYFGNEIEVENVVSFSLPPKPPMGGTDIRFSGDTKLCSAKECVIEVMNERQSLFIECEIKDGESWELVDESGNVFECSGFHEFEFSGKSESLVLRKSTSPQTPTEFALFPAHPNPFNPVTTIKYDIPENNDVKLTVFDLSGRVVTELMNQNVTTGSHHSIWNGKDKNGRAVSSGVYIYNLTARSKDTGDVFTSSNKMILLK